jgi:hypothetical protein
VHAEVALAESLAADLHHPGALVETGHLRPAAQEFPGIEAGAAGRVEDPLARHVAEQRQAGGPVVVGVIEPVACVLEELPGEHAVLGLASGSFAHPPILPRRRPLTGRATRPAASPRVCAGVRAPPTRFRDL